MNLSEHVQYIIHSAKTIVYARDYIMLDTDHLLLALLLDENDMPRILREKTGLDNPRFIRDFNNLIPPKHSKNPIKRSDPPFTKNAQDVLEDAEKEALSVNETEISIEHLFLAIFRRPTVNLNYVCRQYYIQPREVYYKLKDIVENITTVEIKNGEIVSETSNASDTEPEDSPELPSKKHTNKKNKEKDENPLEKYTQDLTAAAAAGKLDPVIGRDEEIRRVIQILNRRSKNNPVIVGEPGVGKTAVIEGLAHRIISGDVPESLKNDKILSLDLGALLAGASYRGEFEERLKSVLKKIEEKSDDLMLFIDEIHTIMGMGSSEGSVDAGNLLKPMLARGNIRVIGATTLDEYKNYIEKDKALERRFQPVTVDEPSVDTTISILRGLKNNYEVFHGIKILDEAIIQAVKLSHRYISDRYLPDKAIDLMDEAASTLRINIDTMPDEIDTYTREKIQLEIERKTLQEEHSKEAESKISKISKKVETLEHKISKLKKQWLEEKQVISNTTIVKKNIETLKSQIEIAQKKGELSTSLETKYKQMLDLEKKLKELQSDKTKKHLIKEYLDADDIASIVAKWTGIPTTRIVENESRKLINMEEFLHQRLIGQEDAVKRIANAIRLSRSGLRDIKRPIGSFLFLGPTGVGKTELGKTLAEFLFNDEDALIRIDMSEFMEKSAISRLTGTTAGYIGYEEGGQLTEAVRRKPYSVVLFDEIEKAHPDIFNIMLQMFDDGRLTDGQGKLIDFKNTVLIMTSNLGSEILLDNTISEKEKDQEIHKLLRSKFKPEFINRIDEIITFKSLTLAELVKIVEIQLSSLKTRVQEQGLTLEMTENTKIYLANKGYEPLYGARPLRRIMRQEVEIPLSLKLLENKFQAGDTIILDSKNDELTITKKE